jgi:pre-mRNA-splicing factor ATP-dependent RNA helicase DHX38/PRP16
MSTRARPRCLRVRVDRSTPRQTLINTLTRRRASIVLVPSLPPRAANIRQRGPETPSHGPGLSSTALQRLEEHRRNREKQREGANISVAPQHQTEPVRGLGDFKNRLNKEDRYARPMAPPPPPPPGRGEPPPQSTGGRDSGWGARGGQQGQSRSWEEAPTPRSERGAGGDSGYGGGSARVPNRGWDETPNARASGSRSASSSGPRGWEATPRTERGESVRSDFTPNQHEWEEEQVKLDRDWYEQDDVVRPSRRAAATATLG